MQDGVSTHIFSAVRPLTSLLEACHAHDMARGQAPLPVIKIIFQSNIFSAVAGDDVDGGYSRIVVQELDYT